VSGDDGLVTDLAVEQALRTAAAVVRHDLEATGAWTAQAAAQLADRLAERRWWVSQWPAGAEHVPGLLAQDVQEAVHASSDELWPCCPEHRDHPLFVEPDLGPDAFWVCHRTGLPVAAVGGL
jgi:hypothetical protein